MSVSFEKVTSLNPAGAIKGEKVPGDLKGSATDPATIEHVYIVFKDDVSPEEGISVIESEVLSGGSLNVSRVDTEGNAIVAIISEKERCQIEELMCVSHVKIEEEAHTTGSDTGPEKKTAETNEDTDGTLTEDNFNDDSDETGSEEILEERSEETISDEESEETIALTVKEDIPLGLSTPVVASSAVVFLAVIFLLFFRHKKR